MNPLTFRVLQLLAPGDFRSGETLGRMLGVTRTSVWHAVRELENAGLEVYKVRGRGYCVSRPLSLLDRAQIERHLGAGAKTFGLRLIDSVDSTNSVLMQQAQAGAPSASIIATEWQSQGRGRRGRPWHAGIGGALTFSVLWRFAQGAGFLAGLSLAAGVGLGRALDRLGIAGAGLKWPNDVVWDGRKLAGILIEMQGDALGPSLAVIGVGINVRLSEAVSRRVDQDATDLETACGRTLDRNEVLAVLLSELGEVLGVFESAGFTPLREEWQRRHVHQGRAVTVLLPDARREHGIVRGVAADGALLLETRQGLRRYHSGEVSLRGAAARTRAAVQLRTTSHEATGD